MLVLAVIVLLLSVCAAVLTVNVSVTSGMVSVLLVPVVILDKLNASFFESSVASANSVLVSIVLLRIVLFV